MSKKFGSYTLCEFMLRVSQRFFKDFPILMKKLVEAYLKFLATKILETRDIGAVKIGRQYLKLGTGVIYLSPRLTILNIDVTELGIFKFCSWNNIFSDKNVHTVAIRVAICNLFCSYSPMFPHSHLFL